MKIKGVKILLLLCLSLSALALIGMGCTHEEDINGSSPLSEVSEISGISESSGSESESSFESSASESSETSMNSSSKDAESSESSVASSSKDAESSETESNEIESSEAESSSSSFTEDESSSSEALPHIHEYTMQVLRKPDCEVEGIVRYTCACGTFYTETPEALGHEEVVDPAVPSTCVKHGWSEGSHCSRCEKILVEQESLPLNAHTYQYGYCIVCNLTGLEFVINHEYNYAICTKYTCATGTVRRVEIPDTYCGYPVKELAANLFADCRDLYSVEIGENVEIIGENAFYGCYHLVEIYDRSKAQVSKYDKFKNGTLTIYAKDENIHYEPFASKIELIDDFVLFHDGEEVSLLTYLGSKKAISIPQNVTRLATYSLRDLEVVEVEIPKSVNYIEKWAFHACTDLERVYFLDPNNWEARGHDHSVCEEDKVDKYEENMPNWTPFEPGDLADPSNGKKALIDLFFAAEWRKVKSEA